MGNLHSTILSPSSSFRWIHCPMSIEYEKDIYSGDIDINSEQAKKAAYNGTLAHEVAEEMLVRKLANPNLENADLKRIFQSDKYNSDMIKYGVSYANKVYNIYKKLRTKDNTTIIRHESLVDVSDYGINCIGTPDAYIVSREKVIVIDYKFGRLEISAKDNTQLMIYALGVYSTFKEYLEDCKDIALFIFEPRSVIESDEWHLTPEKLLEWGSNVLAPSAKAAFATYKEEKTGEWCKYCRGKRYCVAYVRRMYNYEPEYNLISDEEISYIREMVERVKYIRENITREKYEGILLEAVKAEKIFGGIDDIMQCLRGLDIFREAPVTPCEGGSCFTLSDSSGHISFLKGIVDFREAFANVAKDRDSIFKLGDNNGNNYYLLPEKINLEDGANARISAIQHAFLDNIFFEEKGKKYIFVEGEVFRFYEDRLSDLNREISHLAYIYNYCVDLIRLVDETVKQLPEKIKYERYKDSLKSKTTSCSSLYGYSQSDSKGAITSVPTDASNAKKDKLDSITNPLVLVSQADETTDAQSMKERIIRRIRNEI